MFYHSIYIQQVIVRSIVDLLFPRDLVYSKFAFSMLRLYLAMMSSSSFFRCVTDD